jgi:Ca2+-binding RTX toxin-like protein
MTGHATITGFEVYFGSSDKDSFVGSDADETFYGSQATIGDGGGDEVSGGGGDDVLLEPRPDPTPDDSPTHQATIDGGAGTDTCGPESNAAISNCEQLSPGIQKVPLPPQG